MMTNPMSLWMSIAVGFICLICLVFSIRYLIGLHKHTGIATFALQPQVEFSTEQTGSMLIYGEGPRLSKVFAELDFSLTNINSGKVVPLSTIWFRSSSSGFSITRLSLRGFTLDQPGQYQLNLINLPSPPPGDNHKVIITRDKRISVVSTIIVLALSGIGLLFSVFGLIVLSKTTKV